MRIKRPSLRRGPRDSCRSAFDMYTFFWEREIDAMDKDQQKVHWQGQSLYC